MSTCRPAVRVSRAVPCPLPDATQVLRALSGDRDTFDRLAVALGPPLVGMLTSLLAGDEDTARDVVQDAFLAAWRTRPQLAAPRLFPAWLYRVARNRAISWLRHRHPKGRAFLPLVAERLELPDRRGADGEVTPIDDLLPHVRTCLAALPGSHEGPLRLFYLEGLRTREAAHVLGLHEGAFRTRLHRARGRLRADVQRRLRGHPHAP